MNEAAITPNAGRATARTERMCAATRRALPTQAMIRFARRADGHVVPDVTHRLGGRGVWLTASRTIVQEAAKRGVFGKGFKSEARAASTLADDTEAALADFAVAALADAGRAGLVVTGADLAPGGPAIALIEAADSAIQGEFASTALDLPLIKALTQAQMGLALGRPDVVHAALLAGPASILFLTRCDSLVRFRTPEGEVAAMGERAAKTNTRKLERVGNLNA